MGFLEELFDTLGALGASAEPQQSHAHVLPERDQFGRRILGLAPGARSLLIEAEVLDVRTDAPARSAAPPGFSDRPDDPP